MHELALANGILSIVDASMHQHGCTKLYSVSIVVGRLTCVDEHALRFAFDSVTKGTIAAGAELMFEFQNPLAKCNWCQLEFEPEGFIAVCPGCKKADTEITNGKELYIKSIEAE